MERLLRTAVDAGITYFDTARSYDLSEERLGRHLGAFRQRVTLATKVGYGIPGVDDWTYDAVRIGIDDALRTMRTDYLDVVMLHSCNLGTLEWGEPIRALEDAKAAGKIRLTGYSGENDELRWALHSGRFDVLACSVNVCDQRVFDDVLPVAAEKGIPIIAKRPLANAPWRFAECPKGDYAEEYWWRWTTMRFERAGHSKLETAIRFAAHAPAVATAIVGTHKPEHLLAAKTEVDKGPLPEPLISHIRRRFHECDPGWWIGQI